MKSIFRFSFFLGTVLLVLIFVSCQKKSKDQREIDKISLVLEVDRFEQAYYDTPASQFAEIRKKYAAFFPESYPDSVFIAVIQDPLYRSLYDEVQLQYANFSEIQFAIEDLFKGITYHFPEQTVPKKIITLISEMDYESKIILNDTILLISLDMYLGKDHKFYVNEFPAYFCQTFQRSQILPDIVSDFSSKVITLPKDRTLLSQMIYFGKEMYLKDVLLPQVPDADKIAYTQEQFNWCQANESDMWRYFIEESLLYNTNSNNIQRFIAPAPFSKFYLEIDNESPGRTGVWLGWQIVRAFMKNNDVSLREMLALDAKTIFEKSKYKPKK
jgi:gliding motility-associated lipoprotein GldB